MSAEEILFEKEDGVATLTLNRPDKFNAITPEMAYETLIGIFNQIKIDDEIRAIIITGAGKGFCSGTDVSARLAKRLEGEIDEPRHEKIDVVGRFILNIADMDKPVIAAINGIAAAAGLSIALASDIRIASEKARFGAIWIRRGLIPDVGATYFLPRIIGLDKALELTLKGDIIDAQEALKIGLVTRLVPHDELMSNARELAVKIAKGPAVAIELLKRGLYRSLNNDLKVQLDYESYAQNLCRQTDDHKEGVRSFMEKREPNFKGR
ncbi:enoyl-CoA hydratase/isomerase family protein [Thermodesulfobacteriota bacterium]